MPCSLGGPRTSTMAHGVISPTHLPPGTAGDEAHGWSEELSFTMPRPGFPLRLGMIGDLVQVCICCAVAVLQVHWLSIEARLHHNRGDVSALSRRQTPRRRMKHMQPTHLPRCAPALS